MSKEMNVSEGCAIIPPEAAKREIPYIVSWVALGAQCHVPYRDKKDVVGLELNGEWMMVSMKDWELAAKIHDQIDSSRAGNTMSGHEMLQWHRMATALAEKQFSKPRKSVVMTKDKGSAGYWRMILPAKHMQGDFRVDISAAEVKFDYLLEYDTVFVQRVHDWESFYVLEKLKKAGKRIIYDIDDDLFSITPDNPAFYVIGRDNQQAAAACMKLAHEVTVTTALLAHRMKQVVGDIEPIVIPNAMDPDDRWLPTDRTGSPDEWKRIFWQGGASHAEDWMECIEAVDDVMKWRSDVRLVILGFLPPCIQERVNLPEYKNRIEFMGFSDPETYFEMMHHVRADVGLAPLRTSQFNSGKCVDANTRIATNMGIVRAGDVRQGMKVWRNGWKEVIATNTEASRLGFQIETEMGYRLRLTPEHRMFVNGKWTSVGHIVIGDVMSMSSEDISTLKVIRTPWPSDSRMGGSGRSKADGGRNQLPNPNAFLTAPDVPRVDITRRWGRVLGAYAGDGSVDQSGTIQISCDGQDQDWIDLIMDDFRAMGFNPRTESIKTFDGTVLRRRAVRVSSAHLVRVMESIGAARQRLSGNPIRTVCVPDVIWRSPKQVIAEFLAGYFEADGTVCGSGANAVSKNEDFLRDVQRLLVVFGILSRLSSRKHKCQTGEGIYWTLTMNRDAADQFEREIGFRSARKKANLARVTGKAHSNAFRRMCWKDKVVSVSPCSLVPVDLQVEGEEFILAGFVSHNSPIKFIEHSVVGIPTVASYTEPYESVIEEGVNGLLVADKQGWVEAIEQLLTDADVRRKMVDKARATVREQFDIKEVAEQWQKVLLP